MTELEEFPYAVFAGNCYYPEGGAKDFQDLFPTIESAKIWVELNAEEVVLGGSINDLWAEIVDRKDMKILMEAVYHSNGWQWTEKE